MSFKHCTIVAGELSGDHHASTFVEQLKDSPIRFSGMGGHNMAKAGVEIIQDIDKLSVTGATEVIKQFKHIKVAFNKLKQHLADTKPDLLVLVDYPGFNLRLAKYAKSLGIKILYYISPQVWAWKKKRVKLIKQVVDMMAVILPFEKAIYQQANVPVRFVGHPLASSLNPSLSVEQARQHFGLSQHQPVIALLPGSRKNELHYLLPQMLELVALNQQNYQFIMPVAEGLNRQAIESQITQHKLKLNLIEGHALDVMHCSDGVIVASGTASLECALLNKPMAIVYKTSPLTYALATLVIKVKYLGLSNLLANAMVVPELLQKDYNIDSLNYILHQLTKNTKFINSMHKNLSNIKQSLSECAIDCSIAELIKQQLEIYR